MALAQVTFPRTENAEFHRVLRSRVREYFKTQGISTHHDYRMVIKTIVMVSLWFVPYFLMIFGVVESYLGVLAMWILMGFGMAGIGLAVMHDANHMAYSQNKSVNLFIGYVLNVLGGNAANWRIQHNVLHHSYTNIDDMDEDIAPGKILRMSPHQEKLPIHKYQHIYAWFLYSLMTIMWITVKEFRQLIKYKREGLISTQNMSSTRFITELILTKLIYYAYALALPIYLIDLPWYFIVSCFIIMHLIGGFLLAAVFQPAHVMPSTSYPLPDDNGQMENHWAIHQLMTTTNFATGSRWFSWYVGGLNFQIEHHLFPNICHIHYRAIAPIVQRTAEEFSLPYHTTKTFAGALVNHGKMLKQLGE